MMKPHLKVSTALIPRDAMCAALRIVAIDEGTPGADDEVDYLDAVAVARALLAIGGNVPPREWTLGRICRWAIGLAVILTGTIFAVLMMLPEGGR